MKRFINIVPVLAACALLAACGGEGGVTAKTDPVALRSEKLSEEAWTSAFESADNFCMKMVIKSAQTEKEATMSEVTTVDFCNDGDRVRAEITVRSGEETTFEAQSYADLTGEHAIWSRTKADGEWSEWDSETYTSEQFAQFFGGFSAPSFARDNFSAFAYSDGERGYEATQEGLSSIGSAVDDYLSAALSQTPVDVGGVSAEKCVLKFTDGKPSACLFEAGVNDGAEARSKEPRHEHIPPLPRPLPLPHICFTRHGRLPRILIRITPRPRTAEPTEPDVPETPVSRIAVSQLFYNYGKTRVTFPEDLPPLNEQ